MLTAGRALLILALATALYGVAASLYGARLGDARSGIGGWTGRAWVHSGRRAVYALAGILAVCFLLLELAFLRSDFTSELVASHSSTTTPAFYRATAIWSSQEGSLLLWVLLLSVWSSAILFLTRRRAREIAPYATAVLLGLAAFFCGLLIFLETPFARASPVPVEGLGLNPLLRHPAMMFHPPMLYSGYTLFTIPFAFADRRPDHPPARRGLAAHDATLCARRLVVPRRRHRARRALVVLGARLGRVLGLGRGRERVADALADRDRVPAFGDRAGEARDAEDVERVADPGRGHPRDPRHVPRPLGHPRVDPRVRRLDPGHPVPGADRGADPRLGAAGDLARADAAVRAPAGLAAVARGDLPAEQPRAGRALLRDPVGDLLPADLRGLHRHQVLASGRRGSAAT